MAMQQCSVATLMSTESTCSTSPSELETVGIKSFVAEAEDADFRYPVTLALDFGTTYSGCSYAFAHDDEVYDIIKWPKHSGFYAKVPTALYYKKDSSRLLDWGNGARLRSFKPVQEGSLVHQFKLWLADDLDNNIPPLLEHQSAVDAIADYLHHFHDHIMEELMRTFAQNYSPDQFRYCVTVPAIWSDKAKAAMREAVIKAGIIERDDDPRRLVLVSEPEAAALYCEQKYHAWNLGHQDKFMVLDAGGGTIDLIVYEIDDDTSDERTLHELTKGHGGLCGSAYIDLRMCELLKNKFGDHADDMPLCTLEMIMDTFVEKIKPNFDGKEDQYLEIPATACQFIEPHLLNEDGCVVLEVQELVEKVFDPVFNDIKVLVDEQIERANTSIDAIFLVGGFGCSEFLYETLKAHVASRVPVLAMPPRPELAVSRGAIYHMLKPKMVRTKILRRTYGVRTRLPFEEGLDPESSAVITSDGVKRCSTRFDIVAERGERIHVDSTLRRSFWVVYPKHTEVDLYVYDGDGIPPRHITDPAIHKIADFPVRIAPLSGVQPGDRIDVTVDFVFGQTELKILVSFQERRLEFTIKFE
ncbi:uncharacterized protein BYT42DRAFT_578166 [Radiomyces spectabilis]|uniref:uncharacterized protein n=1 Tax=Radiomyces spectabilis TaxID=64574 RepID=UPI00221EA268|nr:uncharacterized protein BYT42DRAFT_578166 [Radiomyces spectabilis]KAI8372829.1 hypothetical protein BYT42DRAFT_578166 [Radiomyces spectabilis]